MPHLHDLRVYWEDTDAGGIVYYANYLKFAERARSEALRKAGYGQQQLRDEQGIAFVVRRCEIDYHKAARLDDVLRVESCLQAVGKARMTMTQRILREGVTLASLNVTLACVDKTGRPVRIPDAIGKALQIICGEKND